MVVNEKRLMFDQHAVSERVRLEEMQKEPVRVRNVSRRMLLSPLEADTALLFLSSLDSWGISLCPDDPNDSDHSDDPDEVISSSSSSTLKGRGRARARGMVGAWVGTVPVLRGVVRDKLPSAGDGDHHHHQHDDGDDDDDDDDDDDGEGREEEEYEMGEEDIREYLSLLHRSPSLSSLRPPPAFSRFLHSKACRGLSSFSFCPLFLSLQEQRELTRE
jgi:hypothetical protein